MPVSKDTAQVRGIAKKGPMVNAHKIVMALPKAGHMGLANSLGSSPSRMAMARMPKRGRPTPLMQKPRVARDKFSPAICPKAGGKIKLPAPKKKENSIKPMGRILAKLKFLFITYSHFRSEAAPLKDYFLK